MKTTVIIEDKLYRKLVDEAMRKHGSAKNLSLTLNELLKKRFVPRTSMFGKLQQFSLKDLRDKNDRSP